MRSPLVLSLSRDGLHFDTHYNIGDTHFPMKRPGSAKIGEYGYPESVVHAGSLYVISSRQKEAIEVLRIPLEQLKAVKK
jgi:hypothetical protein